YDRALDYFQRALNLFQRLEDRKGVSGSLTNVGLIYSVLGQNKKALDYYERALAVTDESDPAGLATLLGNLGGLSLRLGQADAAIRYFTRSQEIEGTRGDRKGYSMALDGLAQAYSYIRQFDRALQYQLKALAVMEPTGNLREIARILNN